MTGRKFFLLLGGMTTAAVIASITSNLNSSRDSRRQADERTADRLQAFVSFLEATPPEFRGRMLHRNWSGIVSQAASMPGLAPDSTFSRLLSARGGALGTAIAEKAEPGACFPDMGGPRGPPPAYSRHGFGPDMPQDIRNLRSNMGADQTSLAPPECRLCP